MTTIYLPSSPINSDVESPLLLPTHCVLSSRAPNFQIHHRQRWFRFFGTAAITGILFHVLLLGLGSTAVVRQHLPTALNDWLSGGPNSTGDNNTAGPDSLLPPVSPISEEAPWTINQLREMVGHTKGYYGRDYTLALGWNNVSFASLDVSAAIRLSGDRSDTSPKRRCFMHACSTVPSSFLHSSMRVLVNGRCE